MSTHTEPSREYCLTFRRRAGASGGQRSADDQPTSDADVGIVDVRIFWVPSARSPSGNDWQRGLIVVHRVTSCGFSEASRQELPIPESPARESGDDDSAAERLMDAFDKYVAKNLVGPAWKRSSEVWVTPICEDVAAVADRLSDFNDQWHDLVLGKPVQYLAGPTILSDIAAELALPTDAWFGGIKRLVQISGILFGLTSGQPLLVNACLKSVVHDILLRVVSEGIGSFLNNILEQADDLKTVPARDERKQQTTALKELLGIARAEQGERVESEYDDFLTSDQDARRYDPEPIKNNSIMVAGRDEPDQTEKQNER